jgi:hypothetical protein
LIANDPRRQAVLVRAIAREEIVVADEYSRRRPSAGLPQAIA